MIRGGATGNQRAMRERNLQQFIELLLVHGAGTDPGWHGLPETELDRGVAAGVAELTRASIANFENALAGILDRDHRQVKNRPLRLDPTKGVAIGVDFGHRSVRVAIGDLHAQLPPDVDDATPGIREWAFPEHEDPNLQLDWAADQIKELVEKFARDKRDVVGIGISIAAPIDHTTGLLDPNAVPHRGWRRKNVAEELRQRLGWNDIWCRADNDARLSARTQVGWGPARDKRNVIYVKWAEGIGSGLWLDGRIYRGGRGFAGEFGHVRVSEIHSTSRVCDRCGETDCLEMAAGGIRLWEVLGGVDKLNQPEEVLTLARSDRDAAETLNAAADAVGRVLATMATMFEPELIVLGGTIGVKGYDLVRGRLEQALDVYGMDFVHAIPLARGKEFGRTAVRGAILWALETQLAEYGLARTARDKAEAKAG